METPSSETGTTEKFGAENPTYSAADQQEQQQLQQPPPLEPASYAQPVMYDQPLNRQPIVTNANNPCGPQAAKDQPNVVIEHQPSPKTTTNNTQVRRNYVGMAGWLAVTVGSQLMILNVIQLVVWSHIASGTGFWAGSLVLLAGIFGVVASRGTCGESNASYICCMVLCIIASITSFVAMSIESWIAVGLFEGIRFTEDFIPVDEPVLSMPHFAVSVSKAFFFMVGFVVTIVEASFCCRCC